MSAGRRNKLMWVLFGAALTIVAMVFLLTFSIGRHLLFARTHLSAQAVQNLARARAWTTVRIEAEPGIELVGLCRTSSRAEAPWLLFFGGNAFDLATSQYILGDELGRGDYNAAVFAYRGYDGSQGEPSEAALVKDAMTIVDYLGREHSVRSEQLFLIGQSLGTGIAMQTAATLADRERAPRGLVLLSPYTSIRQVFQDQVPFLPIGWAVRDAFDSHAQVERIRSPVLMIHGEADRLINPGHSAALAQGLPTSAERIVLLGRGHNDLWQDSTTAESIVAFIDRLSAPASR